MRAGHCYRHAHHSFGSGPLVKLHRLLSTVAAAGLALLGLPAASAAAFTAQEVLLLRIDPARAPLALSGDGAWRLHVDTQDVLHRVSLADPSRDTPVQLPHGVRMLSAS